MAGKKKISIAEAMQVLRDNKINVTLTPIEQDDVEVIPPRLAGNKRMVRKIGTTAMSITLFSQHTVGGNGVVYGPGVVTVPTALASQLLHQDQLAQQADEKMFETKARSYLIMQKQLNGITTNVGVQVDNSVFDGFGTNMNRTITV